MTSIKTYDQFIIKKIKSLQPIGGLFGKGSVKVLAYGLRFGGFTQIQMPGSPKNPPNTFARIVTYISGCRAINVLFYIITNSTISY